jgi:hypothetical protein
VGDHCRAAHTTEIVKNTALESHRAKEPDVRGLQTIAKARCMKQNIQGMLHCGEHVRETLKSLQLYAQCYDLGGCVTVKIASIQGSRRLTFCSATRAPAPIAPAQPLQQRPAPCYGSALAQLDGP